MQHVNMLSLLISFSGHFRNESIGSITVAYMIQTRSYLLVGSSDVIFMLIESFQELGGVCFFLFNSK